jgi:pimaricinolide synthase PimS1
LGDVAFSLATTRAALEHRAVVVAEDHDELVAGLDTLTDGATNPYVIRGRSRSGAPPAQLAFMFTGQGSQWPGMGRRLHADSPFFATTLDAISAELDRHLDRPIKELMFAVPASAEAALLDQTEYTQPAVFALEVALFRLLEKYGLTPGFLIGHSIGELAAAHVAGVLSLADACALVAARGRLMAALPDTGAMVSLRASEAETRTLLTEHNGAVSIAALNAPNATVISGERQAVLQIAERWSREGKRTKRLNVSRAFHSAQLDAMLGDFRRVAEQMDFHPPGMPLISTVTGQPVAGQEICSPDYWVRQVRQPVRFLDGIRWLDANGVDTYLEVGPAAALSASSAECLADSSAAPGIKCTIRSGERESRTIAAALASVHLRGHALDWAEIFTGAQRVELPTYPFQRRRYWRSASTSAAASRIEPNAFGFDGSEHALIGAMIELADGQGLLFTGQFTARSVPWLSDYRIDGTTIVPSTAFLDMALHAARAADCAAVERLDVEMPLSVPERGAVRIQVRVADPDDAGRRAISIHSRTEGPGRWQRHATGVVGRAPAASPARMETWPPAGAVPVDRKDVQDRLAAAGFGGNPAFRSLRTAFRLGSEVIAELQLPEDPYVQMSGHVLHPALLDAALHITLSNASDALGRTAPNALLCPASWTGAAVYADGGRAARVWLSRDDQGHMVLDVYDTAGAPVARIDSLRIGPGQGGSTPPGPDARSAAEARLYEVQWVSRQDIPAIRTGEEPVTWALVGAGGRGWFDVGGPATTFADLAELRAAVAAGQGRPDLVFLPLGSSEPAPGGSRAWLDLVLRVLQDWLADERPPGKRLVLVTREAAPGLQRRGEDPALAEAAVWGLVRSAQNESPGRLVLLDVADTELSVPAIASAVTAGETQLALRGGDMLFPRLGRVPVVAGDAPALEPDGTVLITGGTGDLGARLAGHLVREWNVRHLVLMSRRGAAAQGATGLRERLTALGAKVTIVACDGADRTALARVIGEIPSEHPLTAVVHAAGTVEDATIGRLTPALFEEVLRAKADIACNLHELTRDLDLAAFVMFSSYAATIGSPGQGNYSAANACLEALAAHRRACRLPAIALGWGQWVQAGGMAAALPDSSLARLRRLGIRALDEDEGTRLFDAAVRTDRSTVLPMALDLGAWQLSRQAPPSILRDLVGSPGSRQTDRKAGPARVSLPDRLAAAAPAARHKIIQERVCALIAEVLGADGPEVIEPDRDLFTVGLESLTALELLERIADELAVSLPTTAVMDNPTPEQLSQYLLEELMSADVLRSESK